MKALFITRCYPPVTGGMEKLSYQITTNFSRVADTIIIANKKGKYNLPFFIPWALIKGLIVARKADVIHLGDPVLSAVGYFIKLIWRKPIVVTLHGLDVTLNSKIYQWYLSLFGKKFDKYICISRQTEKEAKKRGFPNITIIPIGIDMPEFVERSRSGLEAILKTNLTDKKVLLTVGRLVRRKGVQWFIENVLPRLGEEVLYLVVGEGEEKSNILQAVKDKGLSEQVFVLGRVSDEDLKAIYTNSDVFIMPNIKVAGDMEGFGIVAIEAAAYGLPVVASDMEGIRDAVVDGKSGFLVGSADHRAYLKIINHLLSSEDKRNDFGQHAQKYIRDNYGWPKIVENYLNTFKSLL